MSKFIDADKLIKRLEKWNTSDSTDKVLYNFAMNRIMEQPIAYDTDEVVEQLEKLPQYKSNLADAMSQIQKFGNTSPLIRLDKAIEIVKAGGIND